MLEVKDYFSRVFAPGFEEELGRPGTFTHEAAMAQKCEVLRSERKLAETPRELALGMLAGGSCLPAMVALQVWPNYVPTNQKRFFYLISIISFFENNFTKNVFLNFK